MNHAATSVEGSAPDTDGQETPWQLKMFSKTLKKQQKLALLLDQIGDVRGKRCLLITNGDNNGALNYHFRAHGGDWTWVENEDDNLAEMQELLGEEVLLGSYTKIPVEDAGFDVVVSIDVHEHLQECATFNSELVRVVKPGGTVVVTTPNGTTTKPVTLMKHAVGMTPDKYGHVVVGYEIGDHEKMLSAVGLQPVASGSYSKFFTEFVELMINFAFVMVLSRKGKVDAKQGQIAPTSGDQMKSVEKQLKLYSLIYPVLLAISKLDVLCFPFTGYAVSVVAKRPS